MYHVSASDKDLTALRLILMVTKGPRSWDDLKTVDDAYSDDPENPMPEIPDKIVKKQEIISDGHGNRIRRTIYNTFLDAAIARGLYNDDQLWVRTLLEAAHANMSSSWFRRYFANILMFSRPNNPRGLFENEKIFSYLLAGLGTLDGTNLKDMEQEVLKRLEYYFVQNNTSCE
jgi:hypothetical protein